MRKVKFIIMTLTIFLITGCSKINVSNTYVALNLSDAYKEYFDIGVAVTSQNVRTLIEENLVNEFSTLTAEYEMKWDQVENTDDNFNFENFDKIASFARENNKLIRGHTLVWRTNVPNFISDIINSNDDTNTKIENVLKQIEDYYIAMNDRYGDVVNVYDVVNEVIEDSNDYMYRYDNVYFELCNYDDELFEEFIANVFKIVKEVSPDVKRYYNDYYLLTDKVKRDKTIKFINNINELGADVEGVGMQSHITTSITKEQVDSAISDFRKENISISFTELDISIYETGNIAPTLPMNIILLQDYEDKLSRAYNHIFSAARENKDIIDNITFWGIYDKESWLVKDFYNYRTDFPLLFDEYYNKKNAYYIVKDFEVIK